MSYIKCSILLQLLMLVPEFRLSQDANHVQVTIRLPYVKVNSAEFYITQSEFKFYLKPYLLSLGFNQNLKEVQQPASLLYDHNKHLLLVKLLKENPEEQFTGLDLLPRLLIGSKSNKKPKDMSKMIVAQGETAGITYDESKINPYSYGFANNYENVFTNYQEQVAELFAFNPQQVSLADRPKLEEEILRQDFDIDSYLFDLYENEQQVQTILQTKINLVNTTQPMERDKFLQLLKIPSKNLLVNTSLMKPTILQLLNISFSFVYELISMSGQLGPQSGRTISRTSSVLSCNINFQNSSPKETLLCSYKRCITYSLYKHLQICSLTLEYLKKNFSKQLLTSILCQLHKIFSTSEARHFLNKIYVDDYIIFVQEAKNDLFEEVRTELEKVGIKEEELGLALEKEEDIQ